MELIVVIAILGVLTAIAVPTVTTFLGSSKERAYEADLERIQVSADAYLSDPSNTRFQGKRQYPTLAALKTGGTNVQPDADADAETLTITGNPKGGTEGGSPKWIDDANGVRDATEEDLNDEDDTTLSDWHVAAITVQGTSYIVDSRDYFVDFDALVTAGYLEKVPESASPDNKKSGSTNTYDGSYSWYVDSSGQVKSIYYFFPESDKTGYQEAYP